MKNLIFKMMMAMILIAGIASVSCNSTEKKKKSAEMDNSLVKKEVFTVYGNCEMCEKTIEGALKDEEGIDMADWDRDTKKLAVSFNPEKLSLNDIKQKVADVGYDSDTHRAKDEVYSKLPGCCRYERPEKK